MTESEEFSERESESALSSSQDFYEGIDNKDFVFVGYECDNCKKNPANIRYHCRSCEDYDLCHTCYQHHRSIHPLHLDFDAFDREDEEKL